MTKGPMGMHPIPLVGRIQSSPSSSVHGQAWIGIRCGYMLVTWVVKVLICLHRLRGFLHTHTLKQVQGCLWHPHPPHLRSRMTTCCPTQTQNCPKINTSTLGTSIALYIRHYQHPSIFFSSQGRGSLLPCVSPWLLNAAPSREFIHISVS
jgi:hypothetical protein